MFTNARLKLTGWYLLIIMLISISFSMVIYKMLTIEVERFARAQRFRMERRFNEGIFSPVTIPILDPDLVTETNQRIASMLVFINAAIMVCAGGLGYFLAGRTLKPIQLMLDEQNRFITDASHELRTPLTSLKSMMEVHLRDKKLKLTDAKKLITESIDEVNKLQSLSDGLLELARYQIPQGTAAFEQVSLADVVQTAMRKVEPIAQKKNSTLQCTVDPLFVEGNKDALTNLLVILLDNAVKYSFEATPIQITVGKTDKSATLSVADCGIGIDSADIPHIFDRFFRADSARGKTKASGYGLGLAIANKIVKMHHGSISLVSTPNSGTTFTVRLPLSTL